MAAPFDKAFKLFAEQEDLRLLRTVAKLPLPDDAVIEHLDRELDLATLHVDHLYRVTTGAESRAVHLEAFSHYDSDWRRRHLRYGALIWVKYEIQLTSYMFLLTEHGVPAELKEQLEVNAGDLEMRLRVRIVKMWEIPAADLLQWDDPAVLAWVPLTNNTPQQLREAASKVAASGDAEAKARMTLLYGLRYLGSEVLEAMFTLDLVKDTPLYKKIFNMGMTEGAERERQLMRRLLTQKFGPLPEAAEAKLQAASMDDLDRWGDHLLNAKTIDEALA